MNSYYVYIYWRLDTNTIFYVGKGKGKRYKNLRERNNHFMGVIRKDNLSIAVEIIKNNLTENEAFYWEEKIIETLVFDYGYSIDIKGNDTTDKGYNHLCNQTWGGDGTSGIEVPQERRERISNTLKGKMAKEKNPMWKRDWREGKTEEELERIKLKKIKNSPKGKNHWNYGKHHSEETREKIRKGNKGKKFSQERRDAMKGKRKGLKNNKTKSVICLTTKKIFITMTEASEYYNVNKNQITKCCLGFSYGYGKDKGKKFKCDHAGKLPDGTKLVWRYLVWKHNKKYRIIVSNK